MTRPVALAILVVACNAQPARDDSARAGSGNSATAGTAAAVVAGGSPAPGAPACPATGLWSRCAVVERLERAGLAPRIDSTAVVREEPLGVTGFLVRLGTAELEVYVYASNAARSRDIARVDTMRYLGYTDAVSMQQLPTLIQSANLIAILHSRNDHQRERVGDALTAGPPQASAPTRLPPASSQRTRSP